MKKLEELIYSVKYLPQILYFGSVGLLGYDLYSYFVDGEKITYNSNNCNHNTSSVIELLQ